MERLFSLIVNFSVPWAAEVDQTECDVRCLKSSSYRSAARRARETFHTAS